MAVIPGAALALVSATSPVSARNGVVGKGGGPGCRFGSDGLAVPVEDPAKAGR